MDILGLKSDGKSYRLNSTTIAKRNDQRKFRDREMNFTTVNYITSTATLTNLTIYTLYTVKASAVSSGGIGSANTVKA